MSDRLRMANIRERLLEYYDEEEATEWMTRRHPQLDGRRPIECKPEEVERVLDRLDSGAYL